jgi:hypothetical protein
MEEIISDHKLLLGIFLWFVLLFLTIYKPRVPSKNNDPTSDIRSYMSLTVIYFVSSGF